MPQRRGCWTRKAVSCLKHGNWPSRALALRSVGRASLTLARPCGSTRRSRGGRERFVTLTSAAPSPQHAAIDRNALQGRHGQDGEEGIHALRIGSRSGVRDDWRHGWLRSVMVSTGTRRARDRRSSPVAHRRRFFIAGTSATSFRRWHEYVISRDRIQNGIARKLKLAWLVAPRTFTVYTLSALPLRRWHTYIVVANGGGRANSSRPTP
jgi:hypothetical protein